MNTPADIHTCTPLALKMADELERWLLVDAPTRVGAAAELRRLHRSEREGWRYADELDQQRKADEALLRQALNALSMVLDEPDALDGRPRTAEEVFAAIAAIKERLK